MFRTRLALTGLALGALLPLVASPANPTAQPPEIIHRFHQTLSDAMARSAGLGCEGRIKLLQPAVDETFDLPFIAERALRRHWKTLQASQREQFTLALRSSVVTTYATEFAKPDAVRFTTVGTDAQANGDALVHANLAPGQGGAIALDYVMREREGHWRIVNVLAEGVSDLALRATQYDGLMKSEGFAALMARLDQQTAKLKARCQ
ncbi:MAG: ABC transporter substrate-binding protein [Pseudomonadota bacterium]